MRNHYQNSEQQRRREAALRRENWCCEDCGQPKPKLFVSFAVKPAGVVKCGDCRKGQKRRSKSGVRKLGTTYLPEQLHDDLERRTGEKEPRRSSIVTEALELLFDDEDNPGPPADIVGAVGRLIAAGGESEVREFLKSRGYL